MALWIGDEVWVEAWIDETELSQVEIGAPVSVTVEPFGNRVLTGWVDSISVLTDRESPQEELPRPRQSRVRTTAMVSVRVALNEVPEDLFPGLSALVSITKRKPGLQPHTTFTEWLSRAQ